MRRKRQECWNIFMQYAYTYLLNLLYLYFIVSNFLYCTILYIKSQHWQKNKQTPKTKFNGKNPNILRQRVCVVNKIVQIFNP